MSDGITPDEIMSSNDQPQDGFTRAWLAQAILRMRRELAWLWRSREPDLLAEWLQRETMAEHRRRFFAEDSAASYLDHRIREAKAPRRSRGAVRGSFPWLARDLHLSGGEIFMTALAFAAARDPGVGNLVATLQGDPKRQLPTLGLAQWLWDDPQELAPLSSPAHPLFARCVLRRAEGADEWSAPIFMPILIARTLESPARRRHSPELECVAEPNPDNESPGIEIELLAGRMTHPPNAMHIVPVSIPFTNNSLDAKRAAPALRGIAKLTGRPVYAIRQSVAISPSTLESAAACCWLSGADLMLPSQSLPQDAGWQNLLRPFPIYIFAAVQEDAQPSAQTLPRLKIPSPDFAQRRKIWREEFARHKIEIDPDAIREVAYRFRIDGAAIAEVARALSRTTAPITLDLLIAASQQQVAVLMGPQATLVTPRFRRDELILDAERAAQFDQLLSAMRNIARVHAEWGTGHAWGDSGISALFSGPPGTGKTMAAEVLAAELNMPMYHVDLPQILNKYIGETEKNLRSLFDAAEQAEVVLFFDEAEAFFGQRIQARTSTDRYANMDIGYLLERMDRFRGLAILATNRKKDLDEAFLRRLRYAIEFPVPSEVERKAIWRKSIPPQVSADKIDLDLIAHEFALAGGNIRSIILNACLQASASPGPAAALSMDIVLGAVDREYEKMGRPLTREQKAQWRLRPPASQAAERLGVVQ
jgi:adenylate kinase family enzyme